MSDESWISEELQAAVGHETAPREAWLTADLVRRFRETVGDADADDDVAPPYVLATWGERAATPEVAAAPFALLSGDDWTLARPLRVDERLTYTSQVAGVSERFSSRLGHTLIIRQLRSFRDASGAVVGEGSRSVVHYATRQERTSDQPDGPPPPPLLLPPEAEQPPAPLPADVGPGDRLPPFVFRPTLDYVVRYCGVAWTFNPNFYDPEAARRAGLASTIVPGPFKTALLTRYLAALAGPGGHVAAVRSAYRQPDPTAAPLAFGGSITDVHASGDRRVIDCEVWVMNERGARSVVGSATMETAGA